MFFNVKTHPKYYKLNIRNYKINYLTIQVVNIIRPPRKIRYSFIYYERSNWFYKFDDWFIFQKKILLGQSVDTAQKVSSSMRTD